MPGDDDDRESDARRGEIAMKIKTEPPPCICTHTWRMATAASVPASAPACRVGAGIGAGDREQRAPDMSVLSSNARKD